MINFKYYLKLHILLFIYSLGSICSKLASAEKFLSVQFCIYYILALFVLIIYAIAWQQILKQLSLNSAYANKAITVIWGIVWGKVFFEEKISCLNLIGALMIIVGIYTVVVSDAE